MIKFFTLLLIILPVFNVFGQLSSNKVDLIVKNIYIIEGGAKTKYPFGIKSINTDGNYEKSKRICEQTVRNQYVRWEKWGKTNDFLESLSERYCPTKTKNLTQSEKKCNKYWLPNLRKALGVNTYEELRAKMSDRKLQTAIR